MRIRNAAAPACLLAAAAFMAACSDLAPTEPIGSDPQASVSSVAQSRGAGAGPRLFGSLPPVPAHAAMTIDATFARIAQENPGFAGVYYGEDGALNVVMAGARPLSARARSRLEELGVDPNAQPVRVVRGQYDFVQLHTMHRDARPVLGLQGVVFTDVDERRNRVVIGVSTPAAAAAVERAVDMAGIPRDAVVTELAEPIEVHQALRDRVRPVAGGLQINFTRGTSSFFCTLGFNVASPQFPSVRGFVTNSHCSDTRGAVVPTPYWQASRFADESFIAWEEHDLEHWTGGICPAGRMCRYSDALGARYQTGVDQLLGAIYRTTGVNDESLTIDPANPLFTIVAEIPYPVVGQVLHKVGRTTGWTSGAVTATCQNSNVAGSNFTMLCQDRIATTSAGGDSGSPYFERIGETNQVRLVGIHWGSGGGMTVMSAMHNIRCENQGPAAWITYPGQTPPRAVGCQR